MAILILLINFFSTAHLKVDPLKGKDLFEKTNEIKAGWLGYLKSTSAAKEFSNVPMFIVNKADGTYAKIIGVPINSNTWNSKFVGKTISEKASITRTLIQGIHAHSLGNKVFKVFALVYHESNQNSLSQKGKSPQIKFPCKITVYLNKGIRWNAILERIVVDDIAYQNLQYELAKNF
ncbi:hypothetical protein [Pedobacter aquatilis]|uniref:hypothetical protein n=1 Tax=Pedobacter aquatilis TaxID=351343 RepID=UPI00292CD0A1|nr:hypothetical protein [Pedobacter aquatilis]